MNSLPLTSEFQEIARRIIWFEDPEQAVSDSVRFLTYAMTYATHKDMNAIRVYFSDDDLRYALQNAPTGIIDPRSWSYWHLKLGQFPAPPIPVRNLNEQNDEEPLC